MIKSVWLLSLAFILGTSCASQKPVEKPPQSNQIAQQAIPSQTPTAAPVDAADRVEGSEVAPYEFKKIDFRNFTYPITYKHESFHLQDGKLEFFMRKDLGNGWVELESVDYIDLTNDGGKEAVVQLSWVSCGVSCDGGSSLFYFYSFRKNGLKLLKRIETGSRAYGCSLRSFILSRKELRLELFNECPWNNGAIASAESAQSGGKFMPTTSFTRFIVAIEKGFFRLRRRSVLPAADDVRNYIATVKFTDQ